MLPYGDLIQIDRNLETPIYLQITRAIIQIIEGNQVPLSTRLPSSRSLSKSLGVHRNTILKSFEELELQGWITTIKAKGTYINNSLPRKQLYHNQANSDPQEFDCPKSTLDVFFPEKPDEGIFIDDGLPDHDMIEFVEFSRALNKTLRNNQKLKSLQRNRDPLGSVKLRRALTKYLFKTRGISSKEDEILITNGSQMGIYLCGKLLLRGNQPYLVGSSNYPVADATFSSISPNVYHIPVDENGWDTSHLQQMIPKNNIKMMYLTPHHHYPTTVTLSIKRRLELIREAKQHRVFVLEDDYDFDFHYAHNPIVPMFATSQSPYFIYLGSFSKIISPLLRLGFVVGDSTLIWELAKERKIIDGFGNTFLEEALADMIHSGEISRLRRKSIKSYDDKRKYLANLLKNKLSRQVEFNLPDGGLAFWIKLKKHRCIDIYQELQKQQIFLPNPSRYVDQISKEEGIRIGFASIKKEEMDTLVDKLSSIINGL